MKVRIFEVGPRDGLQNEKAFVATSDKLWFIRKLAQAGMRDLETGLFVRPDRVPQMADSEKIFAGLRRAPGPTGVRYWGLVPNLKGLDRALAAGVTHIALFTAATESFARRNIGMGIQESLDEFGRVCERARAEGLAVRGYISTVFGCPFEGKVAPKQSLKVAQAMIDMGIAQVSFGDTIGVATPRGVESVMKPALAAFGVARVAGHFHDTRGTALANALRAIDLGVRTLDSSAGGLGGCPFAPGATGNLATEDLIYLLDGMGIQTGVDLKLLAQTSLAMARKMARPLSSRYLQAFARS